MFLISLWEFIFYYRKNKITCFKAWGKLKSNTEVELDFGNKQDVLKGKNILLATGSEATELPFAKWSDKVVSSTEALSFESVPKKLIVIGGGYIGLELGSVWSRLGSQVTVVEYKPCHSLFFRQKHS